jgi:hypothetical protein
VVEARAEWLNGALSRRLSTVAGEGASHGARGGRAPLPPNGCGCVLPSTTVYWTSPLVVAGMPYRICSGDQVTQDGSLA